MYLVCFRMRGLTNLKRELILQDDIFSVKYSKLNQVKFMCLLKIERKGQQGKRERERESNLNNAG